MTDLPDWVWQLVIGLDRYEDLHPPLYRLAAAANYERYPCPYYLANLIPEDVASTARVLAKFGTFPPPEGEPS